MAAMLQRAGGWCKPAASAICMTGPGAVCLKLCRAERNAALRAKPFRGIKGRSAAEKGWYRVVYSSPLTVVRSGLFYF